MPSALPYPDPAACAPEAFRAALADLVQCGLIVAHMVAGAAQSEIALAATASAATVAAGVSPLAASLAEAIEADRASAAAHEARRTIVARTQAIAAAFAQTARAIRRTILLAERLDRGWARTTHADTSQAMARRHIARAVADAIQRHAEPLGADRLIEALADRLDAPDTLDDVATRPAEDIIRDICRDLGLDPARMPPATPRGSPVPDTAPAPMTPGGGMAPQRPPTAPPARASPAHR